MEPNDTAKQRVTRRTMLQLAAAGIVTQLAAACTPSSTSTSAPAPTSLLSTEVPAMTQKTPTRAPTAAAADPSKGQLQARPAEATSTTNVTLGVSALGLTKERDTLLYVPVNYQPHVPLPLVVSLHGAGGNAERGIALLQPLADAVGVLIVAPASRRATWDVIAGGYGPDVALIDQALQQVFANYTVDPTRLAVGGFSDGASYALSIGLTNGDLFSHIIAFSPGFMAPSQRADTPRIFISHGTHDDVLPIEQCSRRIVPQLERAEYDVTYREFNGPHTVPPEIALEAVKWYLGAEVPGIVTPSPAR